MASLPPEYPNDLTSIIEKELEAKPKELVVYLEDDSTGVQKSHDVYLITDLSEESIVSGIKAALDCGHRLVFILTNSRVLSVSQTEAINIDIAMTISKMGKESGLVFKIGSRSDSTLRGHFPLEPLVLMRTLEPYMGKFDGVIVTYVFLTEMSRITVNGIHFLRIRKEDGSFWYRPVHLTDFSKDKRFGYTTSNMAKFVEYKFSTTRLGKVKADEVLHINLKDVRMGGPEEVKRILLSAKNGRIITVDLVSLKDLQVFTLGVLLAEKEGKNFLYRSAASFAAARVNMKEIPVLNVDEIFGTKRDIGSVLCLWGSIVKLSSMQLEAVIKKVPNLVTVQFDVRYVLGSDKNKHIMIDLAVKRVEEAFKKDKNVLVFTFPRSIYPSEKQSDEVVASNEQKISTALQEVYNRIKTRLKVAIFKGGVTSSMGLINSGAKRVYILGQISPGIPIAKILPKDNERFPGEEVIIVIGPGNVGFPDTYVKIFEEIAST